VFFAPTLPLPLTGKGIDIEERDFLKKYFPSQKGKGQGWGKKPEWARKRLEIRTGSDVKIR
jgi:hypothetical protein